MRYGGNIVGSYRVAAMALSPQRERRKVSVQVPSSCKVSVGAEEEGKAAVNWEKLEAEAPSPSPWEWGHMAEPASKDFIS